MKRFAFLLVLLALSGCSLAGPLEKAQASYVEIVDAEGDFHCGATLVGERTILTADHCVHMELMRVQGQQPVQVLRDKAEHALVLFPLPLKGHIAKLSHRLPTYGEQLYLLGKPQGIGPLLRKGEYMGKAEDQEKGYTWWMTSILVIGGDSGSGVYDSKGRLVCTVSIGLSGSPFGGIGFMGFAPYAFTAEQWKQVR